MKGRPRTYIPRDRYQKQNQALKGGPGLTRLHLLIHPGDECGNVAIDVLNRHIGELDMLQVEVQQEAMMVRHPPAERLPQLLGRSLDPPIRQRRQLDRIGLAGNQSLDHRPPALADDVSDG
jgi:hypothetical protein